MFKSPFSFKGRIRRLEYGLSMIIYVVAAMIVQFTALGTFSASSDTGGGAGLLFILLFIPLIVFVLAQGVKRSHDIGNSGWFVLIPFYGLWLLFADSKDGMNKWGQTPRVLVTRLHFHSRIHSHTNKTKLLNQRFLLVKTRQWRVFHLKHNPVSGSHPNNFASMSRQEKTLLFLLATINFTHILDFMIMMPLGNYLMPHFKISAQYFSLIVAAYPITAFASGMVAAFFVDRYDRKKVLLFAYTGFIIGTITCGIAPTAGLLMAARILTGLFGGLIGAQVLSIIADTFPYEKRGQAMASVFLAFSVASVFGVPFSLYLADLITWHAPFIFIGILGIVLLPLLMKFLPSVAGHLAVSKEDKDVPLSSEKEIAKPSNNVIDVMRTMFSNRSQTLALLLSGLLMLGHFVIIPFINPYMQFNVGFTPKQTPLIYMVGGVCAMASSTFIGKLADKYGKLKIFTICLLLSLLPIFLITNMPAIPFYYVLIVFGFWFTFSTGRNIPAQAMISTVVNPAERGRFMSFNSSFQQLFTGAASIIAGLIVWRDATGKIHNYHWVGYLSVGIVFGCWFIGRMLAKKQELA